MDRIHSQAYLEPQCEVIEINFEQVVCSSIEAPDFGKGGSLNLDE